MKLAVLFAALALASAVAPPRISLNLEGMTQTYKLKQSIERAHDLGYKQNNGEAVKSKQDWTEKCPALMNSKGVETDSINCPFPKAMAYDHFDKREVKVTTRVYLVDVDGTPQAFDPQGHLPGGENDVQFNRRATYLFKYDAMDKAGNKAEQVVFALILDDTTAPTFDQKAKKALCNNANAAKGSYGYSTSAQKWAAAITVEAVSDWRLCMFTAYDNVEGDLGATPVKYTVNYIGREHTIFKRKGDNAVNWHTHKYLAVNWNGFGSTPTTDLSFDSAAKLFNPQFLGAERVGKFLVTANVEDNAGVYGHNAENNKRSIQTAILIRDTHAPAVYLEGSSPVFQECSKTELDQHNYKEFEGYQDAGALCHDHLDTAALKKHLQVTASLLDQPRGNKIVDTNYPVKPTGGFYLDFANKLRQMKDMANPSTKIDRFVSFDCKDFAGNSATAVTRKVTTVDTEAPTLKLRGAKTTVEYSQKQCTPVAQCEAADHHESKNLLDNEDDGFDAEDRCDSTVGNDDVTMSWGPRKFNARKLGAYVRTYTVKDAARNKKSITRTFVVIDEDKPKITIQGDALETYQASREEEYTDKGATCVDWVDGELSHAVEVSGEVVNMRIPGTYKIRYDCQDLTGNTAKYLDRTVVVQDTIVPELTLKGASVNYLEAGFPYIDAGATATDSLDGDITQYIWTDGDTVDYQRAFYAFPSCEAIARNQKGLKSGEYYITTTTTTGAYKRVLVHCVFPERANSVRVPFTFYVHHAKDVTETCSSLGMKKMKPTKEQSDYINEDGILKGYEHIGNLDEYLCTVVDSKIDISDKTFGQGVLADKIADAEQGKYVISFHVEDKAGNHANVLQRTVIVKDTLPPVVTLSLQSKLKGVSVGIPRNPNRKLKAAAIHGHTMYMAEVNTSNGFVLAAVASAVAGVALLGVSMRKTATSVPV